MSKTTSERLAFIVTMNPDQAIRAFEQTGKSAEKNLGKAEARIDRLGSQMTRFGAISLASAGVLSSGLNAFAQSAAEGNAAIAANEQVLGESSRAVQEWAKGSVEAAGISESAAIDAATSFGSLAKIAGLAGDDVSDFATDLVETAADLAAFADVAPTQVLEDLQSGFAGSTEVLRKYNIFLDDAGLKAAVFRKTGERVTGTLTTQQRILAINAEITRQAADASGQWSRESGELLGQQAQLSAELENIKGNIGQGALPAITNITAAAAGAAGAFGDLNPAVQSGVGTFATYTTILAGATGALSLVGGQAIKARNNLTTMSDDGTRSLNRMGKAAAGAGAALAGLATIEVAKGVLNETFGVYDKQTKALEDLQATLGDTGSSYKQVVEAFAEQTDALDDELRGFIGLGGVYDNFARKQISLIGDQEASLDTYKRSLRDVFDVSPSQARQIVDALIEQRDAAKDAGENVDDLSLLIGTLNPVLNGWEDAQRSVNESLTETATATEDASDGIHDVASSARDAAGFVKTLEDRVSDLQSEIDDERALIQLQDDLDAVAEKAEIAAEAVSTGSEDADQALRDQRLATLDLKESIIDYLGTLGQVPTEVATNVLAAANQGDIDEVERILENLVRERQVIIRAATSGYDPNGSLPSSNFVPDNGFTPTPRAVGGQVRAGETYLVGENGPEVVQFPGSGFVNSTASQRTTDLLRRMADGLETNQPQSVVNNTFNVAVSGDADSVGRSIVELAERDAALNGEFIFLGDLAVTG